MTELPLASGARGPAVKDVQQRLAALGFTTDPDEAGVFAGATEAAVRAFQDRRGLRVDGICGDQTWSSLVEAGYALGDRWLYRTSPVLRGDDVGALQRRLSNLGFHARRVDGIFGPATDVAVREFQRNAGLVVDGIVGPSTLAALARLGQRPATDGDVAAVAERVRLRQKPPTLHSRRVGVVDCGGAGALAAAVSRSLLHAGATTVPIQHPEPTEQAAEANAAEVDAVVALALRFDAGCRTAYFAGFSGESVGGRRLAELIQERLPRAAGLPNDGTKGMVLPVLRETRMPAVLAEIGPAAAVVERGAVVADALTEALAAWACSSWD